MLKTVFFNLHQIELKNQQTYHWLEGFEGLLNDLKRNSINLFSIDKNLENECRQLHTKKEECIVVTDNESMIKECFHLQIPCIAYENPRVNKQDLFRANMLVEGFMEVNYRFVLEVYQRFYQIPIVIATTNRLLIREMKLEDLDELYALYEDASMTRFLEPLYEKEKEIEFTKAYIKNMYGFYGYGLWSILDKRTGKLVGRAGLSNREVDGEIQIELGYMIGVAYQRKGLAFEACQEILKFAVERLECSFVNCFIHPDNVASIQLVKKLGFVYRQEVEIANEKLSWYRWTYEE